MRITVSAGALYRLVVTAVPSLVPLQFQLVFGWTPFAARLMVTALFAGNLTIKPITTPLMRRFGIRRVLLVNGALSVGCFMLLAQLHPRMPVVAMVAILYVSGALRSIGFTADNSLAFSMCTVTISPTPTHSTPRCTSLRPGSGSRSLRWD